jgi:hypothetical protein
MENSKSRSQSPLSKLNLGWGWRITLVYGIFALSMIGAVIYSATLDVNLVEENYYEKEVNYQQVITKKENAIRDSATFEVSVVGDSVVLHFPTAVAQGKIYFIRSADVNNDKKFDLKVVNGKQTFSKDLFKAGSYNLQIDWKGNSANYYWEEKITI